MSKIKDLDKKSLLSSLKIDPESLRGAEDLTLEQMSMARSILKLAGINQEQEYQLCRSLAERLLERVPEPEEIDLE